MSTISFYHDGYHCPWIMQVQSFLRDYSILHNHKYYNIDNEPKVMLEIKCHGYKANINCFYSNDEKLDYKASLFKNLLPTLTSNGIRELKLIAGKNSYYPNGIANQFYKMGFTKIKNIRKTYLLGKGYDILIMMTMML